MHVSSSCNVHRRGALESVDDEIPRVVYNGARQVVLLQTCAEMRMYAPFFKRSVVSVRGTTAAAERRLLSGTSATVLLQYCYSTAPPKAVD